VLLDQISKNNFFSFCLSTESEYEEVNLQKY
jgi:hypothetical protein